MLATLLLHGAGVGLFQVAYADIVTANLTGALLVRSAERLAAAVRTEGVLIVSGLLAHERGDVLAALSGMALIWEREDEGWIGLAVKKS